MEYIDNLRYVRSSQADAFFFALTKFLLILNFSTLLDTTICRHTSTFAICFDLQSLRTTLPSIRTIGKTSSRFLSVVAAPKNVLQSKLPAFSVQLNKLTQLFCSGVH